MNSILTQYFYIFQNIIARNQSFHKSIVYKKSNNITIQVEFLNIEVLTLIQEIDNKKHEWWNNKILKK